MEPGEQDTNKRATRPSPDATHVGPALLLLMLSGHGRVWDPLPLVSKCPSSGSRKGWARGAVASVIQLQIRGQRAPVSHSARCPEGGAALPGGPHGGPGASHWEWRGHEARVFQPPGRPAGLTGQSGARQSSGGLGRTVAAPHGIWRTTGQVSCRRRKQSLSPSHQTRPTAEGLVRKGRQDSFAWELTTSLQEPGA